MIDLHCHILPGLDDGPETLEDALAMCRMALEDGIRTLVAMPHTLNGVYLNEGPEILEGVFRLNGVLRERGLEMEILPGADVRVDPAVPRMIRDGRVMTINNTGRAVMLEFPDYFPPEPMLRFLEGLLEAGILPVISHPERCSQFRDRSILRGMVELGALAQVTAMSLTGQFGRTIQAEARALLEEGLIHIIASDAHSAHYRPPVLSQAVDEAARILDPDSARAMVTDHPRALIQGRRPDLSLS